MGRIGSHLDSGFFLGDLRTTHSIAPSFPSPGQGEVMMDPRPRRRGVNGGRRRRMRREKSGLNEGGRRMSGERSG